MSTHHEIRPVERDCICLERKSDGPHIAACNGQYREKFFGTWLGVRQEFYALTHDRQILDATRGASLN